MVITVVATGFDSDYYRQKRAEEVVLAERENYRDEQPVTSAIETEPTGKEEKAEPKSSWDETDKLKDDEDDLDVPPSLRARLRSKK